MFYENISINRIIHNFSKHWIWFDVSHCKYRVISMHRCISTIPNSETIRNWFGLSEWRGKEWTWNAERPWCRGCSWCIQIQEHSVIVPLRVTSNYVPAAGISHALITPVLCVIRTRSASSQRISCIWTRPHQCEINDPTLSHNCTSVSAL